jgi:hypothetical protein
MVSGLPVDAANGATRWILGMILAVTEELTSDLSNDETISWRRRRAKG